MKNFLIALLLSLTCTSIVFSMDTEVEEANSVQTISISGSAKMSLEKIDTDNDDGDITTIGEYDIKFTASGETDGALVFGASITIDGRIDDSIEGDEFGVYIGASDGTWKLQFGDNDPGIDLVEQIGVADADEISSETVRIIGVTNNQVRRRIFRNPNSSNPQFANRNIRYSESTLPYRVSGYFGITFLYDGKSTPPPVEDYNTLFPIGNGPARIYTRGSGLPNADAANGGLGELAPISATVQRGGNTNIALSGKIGNVEYRLSSGDGVEDRFSYWSFGAKYTGENYSLSFGLDQNNVYAGNVSTTFNSNTISVTFIKQSGDMLYNLWTEGFSSRIVPVANRPAFPFVFALYTWPDYVNEWQAIGVKLTHKYSPGSKISFAYSKKSDKNNTTYITIDGFIPVKRDETEFEIEFDYNLGGGATFFTKFTKNEKNDTSYTEDFSAFRPLKERSMEMGVKMKF